MRRGVFRRRSPGQVILKAYWPQDWGNLGGGVSVAEGSEIRKVSRSKKNLLSRKKRWDDDWEKQPQRGGGKEVPVVVPKDKVRSYSSVGP